MQTEGNLMFLRKRFMQFKYILNLAPFLHQLLRLALKMSIHSICFLREWLEFFQLSYKKGDWPHLNQ